MFSPHSSNGHHERSPETQMSPVSPDPDDTPTSQLSQYNRRNPIYKQLAEYGLTVVLATPTLYAWNQLLPNIANYFSEVAYNSLLAGYQNGYDNFTPPVGPYSTMIVDASPRALIQEQAQSLHTLNLLFGGFTGVMAGHELLWSGFYILRAKLNHRKATGNQKLAFCLSTTASILMPVFVSLFDVVQPAIRSDNTNYNEYGIDFGRADKNNNLCSPPVVCPPPFQYKTAIENSNNGLSRYTFKNSFGTFSIIATTTMFTALVIRYGVFQLFKRAKSPAFCRNRHNDEPNEGTPLTKPSPMHPKEIERYDQVDQLDQENEGCLARIRRRIGW